MKKIWLVFRYEYARRVKTRGFIFAVLSMPLLVILSMGMAVASVSLQTSKLPVGYVDQAGVLANAQIEPEGGFTIGRVDLLPYTQIETGQEALAGEQIQALFVIPPDYLQSGEVIIYANDPPGENATARMQDFLESSLVAGETNLVKNRIREGSNFTVRSLDGSRQAGMRDWFVVLFPFLTGLVFIVVINISGGYLLQSIVDEKENRTMEVIITSISPEQLMVGKILGNLCVGLTQLLIWLIFAAIGLAGMQAIYHFSPTPAISAGQIGILAGIIIPGFILIAALMTLVGVSVTDMREAQQVSLMFTLPMVAPYWFAGAVLQHPENILTAVLSIFPLTAVVTMPLRLSIASVPLWQVLLAAVLMWGSAIGAMALAARAFRVGMLQYTRRIPFKKLFRGNSHE